MFQKNIVDETQMHQPYTYSLASLMFQYNMMSSSLNISPIPSKKFSIEQIATEFIFAWTYSPTYLVSQKKSPTDSAWGKTSKTTCEMYDQFRVLSVILLQSAGLFAMQSIITSLRMHWYVCYTYQNKGKCVCVLDI